jgi:hypothetical protein
MLVPANHKHSISVDPDVLERLCVFEAQYARSKDNFLLKHFATLSDLQALGVATRCCLHLLPVIVAHTNLASLDYKDFLWPEPQDGPLLAVWLKLASVFVNNSNAASGECPIYRGPLTLPGIITSAPVECLYLDSLDYVMEAFSVYHQSATVNFDRLPGFPTPSASKTVEGFPLFKKFAWAAVAESAEILVDLDSPNKSHLDWCGAQALVMNSAWSWHSDILATVGSGVWFNARIPWHLGALWQQMVFAALRLDAGFETWIDWYTRLLMGKPVDWELEKKRVAISKEIEARGTAAVNTYIERIDTERRSISNYLPPSQSLTGATGMVDRAVMARQSIEGPSEVLGLLRHLVLNSRDAPPVFTITAPEGNQFDVRNIYSKPVTLTLWCMEQGNFHPVEEASYDIRLSKDWFITALPLLRRTLRILKPAVSLGAALGGYPLEAAQAQIVGLETLCDSIEKDLERVRIANVPETLEHPYILSDRMESPDERAMRSLLLELGQKKVYPLTKITTPDRGVVWLCKNHVRESQFANADQSHKRS